MNIVISRRKKITIENVSEIIVAICIGCVFLSDVFSYNRQAFIAVSYTISFLIFIYDCQCLHMLKSRLIIFNLVLLIIAFINLAFIGNVTIPFILKFFLVDQSIALFFIGSKKLSKSIWYTLGIIIYSVVWYCMINSVDGYQLFSETSRNYASIYSLFILFFIGVLHYKDNTEIPSLFIFHNLVLSIYCVGRGGIISAAILLLLYYMARIKSKEKFIKKIKIIGLLLLIFAIVLYYMYSKGLLEVVWEKYFWRFYDNRAVGSNLERMAMIRMYVDKTLENIFYLLFGTDVSHLSLILNQKGNVHNSYLMLHKAFGLLGSAILLFEVAVCIKNIWNKRKYEFVSIILAIMLRAFLDSCFPYHLFNVPFMFLAIGAFYKDTFNIMKE